MRLSAFILVGRKEKAGNTSRAGSFHHAHCFNVGECVTTSSNTTEPVSSYVWISFLSIFI